MILIYGKVPGSFEICPGKVRNFLSSYREIKSAHSGNTAIGKGGRRLQAFEMWCYRKLLKIRWVYKVTNEEILNLMKEKRGLYASIKKRRDRLIEHTDMKDWQEQF